MKVPLVDLKTQYTMLKTEIDSAIQNVIDNTEFIKGQDLKKFEEDFARFCGTKFSVGCSSGTTALELALRAARIGPGDEVVTVANTFTATASTIVQVGAIPKFVDVDENTFNINVNDIEKNISEKTKAILPVHLYGQVSDMGLMIEISKRHNLIIIEDCAQAHGSEYNGKRIPVGNIGCFSFYPSKNLGAFGDAGCVVTDDENTASMISMMLDAGRAKGKKYEHDIVGFNYRMDNIQAAILNVKLKYLEEFNKNRRENAKLYTDLLSELKDKIISPFEASYSKHVYYVYTVKVKDRDGLASFLGQNEITTQIYYPIPLHLQVAYKNLGYKQGDLPVTEKLSKEVLSLPMYPELTEEQIRFVVDKIKLYVSS